MKRIRIIVIDDHPIVLEGMLNVFREHSNIQIVGTAENADEAMTLVDKLVPDIVITDINLPGVNGIELCKRITSKYAFIRVMGMSSYSDKAFVSEMLIAGASGYFTKGASLLEIEKAIDDCINNRITVKVDYISDVEKKSKTPVVTKREREVLQLISIGLTNKEIAEKLFVSASTVDSHRKNLLLKFEVNNTASLIASAVRMGVL